MSSFGINNFIEGLNSLYIDWDDFSDFNKILDLENYKEEINQLNNLSLYDDLKINMEFLRIVKEFPKSIEVLFLMIALRYNGFKSLSIKGYNSNKIDIDNFINSDKELLHFFYKSKLREFFLNNKGLHLYSYLMGIIIGLDANSRKNRFGTIMENECELEVSKFCITNGYNYLKQKVIDLGYRKLKADFIIFAGSKTIIIETNNYNTTGSKINSVSEQYTLLNQRLPKDMVFVWITNGNGWLKSKNTLDNNIKEIKHFINLKQLKQGYLYNINLGQE